MSERGPEEFDYLNPAGTVFGMFGFKLTNDHSGGQNAPALQEQHKAYTRSAEVLRSERLTRRQREIAQLVTGLVVVYEDLAEIQLRLLTRGSLQNMQTVLAVLSHGNETVMPAGLILPPFPLVRAVAPRGSRSAPIVYAPAPALTWLADQPVGVAPHIEEAIKQAQAQDMNVEALRENLASDNL